MTPLTSLLDHLLTLALQVLSQSLSDLGSRGGTRRSFPAARDSREGFTSPSVSK